MVRETAYGRGLISIVICAFLPIGRIGMNFPSAISYAGSLMTPKIVTPLKIFAVTGLTPFGKFAEISIAASFSPVGMGTS